MAEKDRINQLFDKVRRAPTELSQAKVAAMLEGVSAMQNTDTEPPTSTPFFNLKNILLMSICISIFFGFFVYLSDDAPTRSVVSPSVEQTQKTMPIKNQHTEKNTDLVAPISEKIEYAKPQVQGVPTVHSENENTKSKQQLPSSEAANKPKSNTSIKAQRNHAMPQGFSVQEPILDPSPIPVLSGLEMRKIKRKLYKNLVKDGIIAQKSSYVEIQLRTDATRVNGKKLPDALLLKYAAITQKAGKGPNRKIKMDADYIKIGDFNPDGFRGSGYGRFSEKMSLEEDGVVMSQMPEMPAMPSMDESLFEKEKRALETITTEIRLRDAYAKTLLKQSPIQAARSRLFSPNVKYKEMKKLHKNLYHQLLQEQRIEADTNYVLIELGADRLILNGLALTSTEHEAYMALIKPIQVKSRPGRQIRLSKHSISVGDYRESSFSGTTTTFEATE